MIALFWQYGSSVIVVHCIFVHQQPSSFAPGFVDERRSQRQSPKRRRRRNAQTKDKTLRGRKEKKNPGGNGQKDGGSSIDQNSTWFMLGRFRGLLEFLSEISVMLIAPNCRKKCCWTLVINFNLLASLLTFLTFSPNCIHQLPSAFTSSVTPSFWPARGPLHR